MSSKEKISQSTISNSASDELSLKLAIAISLLRSKILQRQPSLPDATSESEALRWKRKAKERKQELIRVREDLKEAEDASHCDLFPQSASCKCYFFNNLEKFSPSQVGDASNQRFDDILRRRFLRQVRLKQRRKTGGSNQKRRYSEINNEADAEQLGASVDFLVELCDDVCPSESNYSNWAHQAVDFILGRLEQWSSSLIGHASLRTLLLKGMELEPVEGIISSLLTRLVRKICTPLQRDASHPTESYPQLYVQHLIRKLGSEPYIGQRAIFSVSQRISLLAESLLFSDPFDESFPDMHESMFIMIQLIEFLVLDYLLIWSSNEHFDYGLFQECVSSILHARKAVELLENRNGLYALYMDRVIMELAKQVNQVPQLQKLNPDILGNFFT